MYGREKRVLLREYLEQGLTKTALAVKLGLSCNSVSSRCLCSSSYTPAKSGTSRSDDPGASGKQNFLELRVTELLR